MDAQPEPVMHRAASRVRETAVFMASFPFQSVGAPRHSLFNHAERSARTRLGYAVILSVGDFACKGFGIVETLME